MTTSSAPASDHSRLAALYEISRALGASLDLDEALMAVLDAAIRLMGVERGYLVLQDDETGALEFRLARNARGENLPESQFEISRSIVQEILHTGQPVSTDDVQDDARFADKASVLQFGLRAVAAVPLKSQGVTIGALYVDDKAARKVFDQADLELLQAFAERASLALINARLFHAQKREAEVNRALLDFARRAQQAATLTQFMQTVNEAVLTLIGCDRCSLFLWDEAEQAFRPAHFSDKADPALKTLIELARPSAVPLADEVLRRPAPFVFRGSELAGRVPAEWIERLRHRIVALAPLRVGPRMIGVLAVDHTRHPRALSPRQLGFLETLSHHLSATLQNLNLLKRVQQQVDELSALQTIAMACAQATDENALIETVTYLIGETFYPDNFGVILLDEAAGVLRDHPSYRDRFGSKSLTVPLGRGVCGQVVETGRPWRVADVTKEPHYWEGDPHTRSELCVPLKIGGRVLGVLNLESVRLAAFSADDERLLTTIADQLATALAKLRLFQAEHAARVQAETLREVAGHLSANLDRGPLLNVILDQLARVVAYDSASVMLVEGDVLNLAASRGFRSETQPKTTLRFKSLPHVREALETRRPLIIADTAADPRWQPLTGAEYIRCWLGAPLVVKDRVIGLLNLDKEQPGYYTGRDAELAVAFANQAAVTIENAQLYAEAQHRLLEQTLLYECTQALTLASDPASAIAGLAEQIVRRFGAMALSYYAYAPASESVVLEYEYLAPGALPADYQSPVGRAWPLADYPYIAAALHGHTPQFLQAGDDSLSPAERDMLRQYGGQTVIAVPLAVPDRVLGYLELWDQRPERVYDLAEVSLLLTLANQAAIVVERLRLLEETRRRETELEVLLSVSRAVSSSLDFNEVMKQVAVSIAGALRMENCAISTYDSGAQQVYTLAIYAARTGEELPLASRYYRLVDYPATARVLETGEPLIVRAADPRADPAEVALLRQLGFGLLLMLPLRSGGRTVGLAELYADDAQRLFSPPEMHLARALADQAGVAVENARLFQAEREQHELAEALREVGSTLSATLDFNTVLDRLLDHIARVVPYDTATVMMVEGRRARVARTRGFERFGREVADEVNAASFNISATANLRRMSESGRPLIIPDVTHYPGWARTSAAAHIRSFAGAPILVQSELIAFFTLDKIEPDFYRIEHAERLAAFAGQAALALQNARLFEAERQRVATLTALHETALDLSAQLDLYTLLQTIVERAARLMDAPMGGLYLIRPDAQTLELRVSYNLPRDYTRAELELGEGLPGRAAQTGQPLVVGNYSNWPGRSDPSDETDWESVIGVPIKWRERVLGVLVVVDTRPHRFVPADAEMVSLFADKASVAIVNARLFEETRRQTRELAGLYGTALATSSVLETKALLAALYDQVDELMAPDSFGVALYDAETDQIEFALAMERGKPLPEAQGLRVSVAEGGLTGWVVKNRQPLLLNDLKLDPLPAPTRHLTTPARSWLGAPLIVRDRVLGAVTAQSFRPRAFSESDRRFLESAASQVAVALENARLFEALVDEKGRLELLYTLSQSLTASLVPRDVAARALDQIRTAMGVFKASMLLLEPGTDHLHLIAVSGYEHPESVAALDRELDLRVGQGLSGNVAATGELAMVADVGRDARWKHIPGLDDGVCSVASLPLKTGEELVGIINLYSDQERFFSEKHLPLLRAIAAPVALALQNARLFQAQARRAHHLEALNAITRTALEPRALSDMLAALAERLGELLGADACYIALWDETRQQVIPIAAYGPFRDLYPTLRPEPGENTVTQAVLSTGRALIMEDAPNAPVGNPRVAEQLGVRSALSLPLIAGEQRLGAAIIAFHAPRHFTPDEVARGEQAARQIALALAKARLVEDTRRHADEITYASEILRALNAAPNIPEAFPAIAAGLRAITQCEHVSLALLDEKRGQFAVQIVEPPGEIDLGAQVRTSDTAMTAAVMAGRPHLTPDLSAEIEGPFDRALYDAGYRSRVNLPLRAGAQIIGALNLVWTRLNGYNPDHLPLLGQIADAVALAAEKQRLFDETRRRADELETLSRLSTVMRTAESTGEIMQIVLARSLEVFHADSGAIVVPGSEPDTLVVAHEMGWPIPFREYVFRHDDSAFGHVFRTARPYLVQDAASDPLAHKGVAAALQQHDARPRTSIYAPIRTSEAVIGIIAVSTLAPRTFTPVNLGLLTAIAEITGNALRRAGVMETLEQRVAARTRELAEANERLKELDRLKDVFVSNVSHELRTPITNIKLHLGLLEKRGPEQLERYLPILQRETERLRRLIEDLLNLSRLQAQANPPQREPHVLDALLSEVAAIHAARAEAKRVSLQHASDPQRLEVPMDRGQLHQVFTNLIGNAVAYTPPGGRIRVDAAPLNDGPKPGIAVRVNNDQPVIPADELPHLFDRFYRGAAARESGEPGTGLGLSICKEIVERHGGYIDVESRAGQGTTFTVWLPLAPDRAAPRS
jgi:GAF domain-containing protein